VTLAALVLCGCADPTATRGALDMSEDDAGVVVSAVWHFRSTQVDVDLTLATRESDQDCKTTSRLAIDGALSSPDAYDLAPTDCAVLRLTSDGDIVVDDAPTGVDWTALMLAVDTDTEVISLGPASGSDPRTGDPVSYTFAISAPPCGDGTDCDCGVLRRTGGASAHSLSLGRICD
jgi:hypothetical protein